ncbi:MAG: hypothetical protein GY904_03790 [Planctomycetaceae bacterium]|nr:hypothetical protein [Planctomycetaceae bacterium]
MVFPGVAFAQLRDEQIGHPDYSRKVVIVRPFDAITDPKIVSAAEAKIATNELVIGNTLNGESRAYPHQSAGRPTTRDYQ